MIENLKTFESTFIIFNITFAEKGITTTVKATTTGPTTGSTPEGITTTVEATTTGSTTGSTPEVTTATKGTTTTTVSTGSSTTEGITTTAKATTTGSTTGSTPVYSTLAITSPTTEAGCYCNTNPPRTCNERWEENCSNITCLGGNTYKIEGIICPQLIKPTCSQGIEPVKVQTENGCCAQWECDCECIVWGEPHYRTFNGLQYDFFGNCTYTLVEEQVPKYNFSVLIDNYFCLPSIPKSCPKGLVIFYNENVVTISTGVMYMLTVNGNDVSLPYSSNGFEIIKLGGSTYISIPEIRTSITAFLNNFRIRLPERYFFNNTQGHCGSCSHPAQCTRKNGKVEPSDCCHKTAYDWRVDDPNKPYCESAPTNVPCTPVPPPPTCKTEKTICDIIQENPFEQCRGKINLDKYIKSCHFDHCQLNSTVDCTSLEAAALACASVGICVNWRAFTNGLCNYICHRGFVYKPCQERGDDHCVNHMVVPGLAFVSTVEGCFCPDGMMLAENNTKCVTSCDKCKPRMFTQTIIRDNCEATVEVKQCEGRCFSISKFNFDINTMKHNCQCCHEKGTEEKSVILQCKNGTTKTYKYIDIKSCTCKDCENGNEQLLLNQIV
uniref:intestinal mucin-like protein n=1 Tax=Pristiophorus japonicus TaxID=55135 RepID=UPI00398E33E9